MDGEQQTRHSHTPKTIYAAMMSQSEITSKCELPQAAWKVHIVETLVETRSKRELLQPARKARIAQTLAITAEEILLLAMACATIVREFWNPRPLLFSVPANI